MAKVMAVYNKSESVATFELFATMVSVSFACYSKCLSTPVLWFCSIFVAFDFGITLLYFYYLHFQYRHETLLVWNAFGGAAVLMLAVAVFLPSNSDFVVFNYFWDWIKKKINWIKEKLARFEKKPGNQDDGGEDVLLTSSGNRRR
jgi:hypothetical protein